MSPPAISSVAPWPSGTLARVLSPREWPLPLLGAGISVPCGLPSGAQLAEWMRGLPLSEGIDFGALPAARRRNPLWVTQQVVRADPSLRAPLHRAVADHLITLEDVATPTTALRALARTPNRPALILTLNYDRLVEKAARQVGREVHTLEVEDIPSLLNNGLIELDGSLRVLHLHGSLDGPPEKLALTADDYAARADDQRVRELFSALLAFYNLCIIGSSFEEQYLAALLLARRPTEPRHVIVCGARVANHILSGRADLTTHVHNVLVCDYPDDDHGVLDAFCERLVRRAPTPPTRGAKVIPATPESDPLYEPRQLIDPYRHDSKVSFDAPIDHDLDLVEEDNYFLLLSASEIAVELGVVDALEEDDLRAERRAVVVGIPGAGKSQLLERLAASPGAGERAVLVRLRDVRQVVGEPEALLTAWMAAGRVLDGGEPVPIAAVGAGSVRVHLLLDGLDELPRDDRRRVAEAVVRVGEALPEQRLTLSSRPSSALEVFPAHWRQVELLCGDRWRRGLLQRAGTTWEALAARLGPHFPTVGPLLDVPFFLRGVLDLLDSGRVPRDGLDLTLLLLRRLLEKDEHLRMLGSAVNRWLRRVALTILLRGSTTVSASELRELVGDLDLGDPDLVADLLASRSLLQEASGRYAFQHRLFGEALVAEFLLDQRPEEWLDVLAPRAAGRSLLREDWVGVSDLLLARSAEWRAALAERDPRAAARATPLIAPPQERQRAAQLLWDRAQRLEMPLEAGTGRGGRNDGVVIGSLMRAGRLAGMEARVREALGSGSGVQRSNAVEVVARAGLPDAEALLRRVLVEDRDPTVRKKAAWSALHMRLKNLTGALERRALAVGSDRDADDCARAALKLTPPSERPGLAIRLLATDPGADGELTQTELTAARSRYRCERGRLFASKHLDGIIAALRRPTRRQAGQVAFVAAVARVHSRTVVDFLTRHRHSAVGLIDALDEGLVEHHEIMYLLLAVGGPALRRHGADWRVLEAIERWAQTPARQAASERAAPQPMSLGRPLGLEEIMAIEDRDRRVRLLMRDALLAEEVFAQPDHVRRQLVAELGALWGERDLRKAVDAPDDATVHDWAGVVLMYGPPLAWRLNPDRWAQVALCGELSAPQLSWLREQAEAEGVRRALRQHPSPSSLGDLAEVIGPDDLPALVEVIVRGDTGTLPKRIIERIVTRLTRARRADLLLRLAAHDPAIEHLVALHLAASGDVPAQRAQLERLIARLRADERVESETKWLESVQDASLFELLASAILLAGAEQWVGGEPVFSEILDALLKAAGRVDPPAAVALYDQLIANPPWLGAPYLLVGYHDGVMQRLVTEAGRQAAARAARRLNLPLV